MEILRNDSYIFVKDAGLRLYGDRKRQRLCVTTPDEILSTESSTLTSTCIGKCHLVIGKFRVVFDTEIRDHLLVVSKQSLMPHVLPGGHAVYRIDRVTVVPFDVNDSNIDIELELCDFHPTSSLLGGQNRNDVLSKALISGRNAMDNVRQRKTLSDVVDALVEEVPPVLAPDLIPVVVVVQTYFLAHIFFSQKRTHDKERTERRILEELLKMFNDAESFYYSPTADLTTSLQRQRSPAYDPTLPPWRRADERFFWNRHMLADLIAMDTSVADPWIVPVLHGYIECNRFCLDPPPPPVASTFHLSSSAAAAALPPHSHSATNLTSSHTETPPPPRTPSPSQLLRTAAGSLVPRPDLDRPTDSLSPVMYPPHSRSNESSPNLTRRAEVQQYNGGAAMHHPVRSANSLLTNATVQNGFSFRAANDPEPDDRRELREIMMTLISRRSRHRAGTRYNRRGVDETGSCANYVETEQLTRNFRSSESEIVEHGEYTLSFVQVRGSVPLYWSQRGMRYNPRPVIDRGDDETQLAFDKHFKTELGVYKHVAVVNLVDQVAASQAGGKERVIADAYLKHILHLDSPDVTYITFDFHEHCRGLKFENISILLNEIHELIRLLGYFWSNDASVFSEQKGVFRVNCMDCLDRTNVIQSAIARLVLETQCQKMLLLAPGECLPHHCRLQFQQMWANSGDAVSKQYAGTDALKGDFTRTGERKLTGVMKDGMNSANRYYRNRFKDAHRQATIDMMLGTQIDVSEWRFLAESKPSSSSSAVASSGAAAARSTDDELDAETEEESHEKNENLKMLVDDCMRMLIREPEGCLGAWTLIDVNAADASPTQDDMDTVLLLSDSAYYVASYDDAAEKFVHYQRVPLDHLVRLELGPEPSLFTKSRYCCLRIWYRWGDEAGGFHHTFRSTSTRLFNNMVLSIRSAADAKEALWMIAETFKVAHKHIIGSPIEVSFDKLERRKSKPPPNLTLINQLPLDITYDADTSAAAAPQSIARRLDVKIGSVRRTILDSLNPAHRLRRSPKLGRSGGVPHSLQMVYRRGAGDVERSNSDDDESVEVRTREAAVRGGNSKWFTSGGGGKKLPTPPPLSPAGAKILPQIPPRPPPPAISTAEFYCAPNSDSFAPLDEPVIFTAQPDSLLLPSETGSCFPPEQAPASAFIRIQPPTPCSDPSDILSSSSQLQSLPSNQSPERCLLDDTAPYSSQLAPLTAEFTSLTNELPRNAPAHVNDYIERAMAVLNKQSSLADSSNAADNNLPLLGSIDAHYASVPTMQPIVINSAALDDPGEAVTMSERLIDEHPAFTDDGALDPGRRKSMLLTGMKGSCSDSALDEFGLDVDEAVQSDKPLLGTDAASAKAAVSPIKKVASTLLGGILPGGLDLPPPPSPNALMGDAVRLCQSKIIQL